ncbi:hypothetical protein K490DRAFT_9861, partial [Saccharata proteae CBS 121410]
SSSSLPRFSFEELYQLQSNFWDNFLYPANKEQANSINSTLLATDVLGRVDATRTFDGQELNTEYLFGLFSTLGASQSTTLLGVPVSYDIVHFIGYGNIASAATIVYFNNTAGLFDVFPVEIDTWIMFNEDGQIWQYDATYRYFEYLLDSQLAEAAPKIGTNTTDQTVAYFTDILADGICTTAMSSCNGTNTIYDSYDDCYEFLTKEVPFGTAYGLGMNTLLCRMVHENMVPFRPDVHCPHISREGGGMCVDDYTYASKVLQPYY